MMLLIDAGFILLMLPACMHGRLDAVMYIAHCGVPLRRLYMMLVHGPAFFFFFFLVVSSLDRPMIRG